MISKLQYADLIFLSTQPTLSPAVQALRDLEQEVWSRMSDEYVIIEGELPSSEVLRPRNWAERFAGNLASYGADRRLRFSTALEPVMINNIKCLRMDKSLRESHPQIFHDVLGFASGHRLAVHGLDD